MTFTCLSDTEYVDFFLMNLIKDVQAIKNRFMQKPAFHVNLIPVYLFQGS